MIYADNAATTKLDIDAFEAMKPWLLDEYGNASQPYSFARKPKKALAEAREIVAACINAKPEEIYFTSGGTESDNWAIKSAAFSNMEHKAIIGWSDKHDKIATFRVDRIYQVPEILAEDAVPKPKKYNIGEFAEKAFQLYDSEHAEVELVCENAMMSTVLDHFGTKIKPDQVDTEHFSLMVDVSLSPTFFAWVFEFGGKIKIKGPQNAVDAFKTLLEKSFYVTGAD